MHPSGATKGAQGAPRLCPSLVATAPSVCLRPLYLHTHVRLRIKAEDGVGGGGGRETRGRSLSRYDEEKTHVQLPPPFSHPGLSPCPEGSIRAEGVPPRLGRSPGKMNTPRQEEESPHPSMIVRLWRLALCLLLLGAPRQCGHVRWLRRVVFGSQRFSSSIFLL